MILRAVYAILILFRGNKMVTEFLIACILLTMQIIEILRAKILKQILLRLFCRERMGVIFQYRIIINIAKWDDILLGFFSKLLTTEEYRGKITTVI